LTCDAFPDENNNSDVFLAGLITAAVTFGAVSFASAAFSFSLATDVPQLSGRTASLNWGIHQRLLMGAAPWTALWTTEASASRVWRVWRALKLRSAATWSSSLSKLVLFRVALACTAVARRVRRLFGGGTATAVDAVLRADTPAVLYGPDASAQPPPSGVFPDVEAATAFSSACNNFRRLGLVMVYAAWGLLVWFVLVYGALIYRLLGDSAEKNFIRTWGLGLGLSQVNDFRDVLISLVQLAAAVTILEALWLTSNRSWFEATADALSIQRTTARGAPLLSLRQLREHALFTKSLG
jgi:hypothetical protein